MQKLYGICARGTFAPYPMVGASRWVARCICYVLAVGDSVSRPLDSSRFGRAKARPYRSLEFCGINRLFAIVLRRAFSI